MKEPVLVDVGQLSEPESIFEETAPSGGDTLYGSILLGRSAIYSGCFHQLRRAIR